MATSKGLRAWADTLRRWGELVDTTEILVVAGVAVIAPLGFGKSKPRRSAVIGPSALLPKIGAR